MFLIPNMFLQILNIKFYYSNIIDKPWNYNIFKCMAANEKAPKKFQAVAFLSILTSFII